MTQTKTYSNIEVIEISKSTYDPEEIETAELEQVITITTTYPGKKATSSLQDNPFADDAFKGLENNFTKKEIRKVWIPVPKGTTVLDMEIKLAQYPNARIYRVLSSYPILSDEEQLMLSDEETSYITKDEYAMKQIVRFGEKAKTPHKLIFDKNGKAQYRRLLLSLGDDEKGKEDVDNRTDLPNDFYVFPGLLEEINSTIHKHQKK